MIRKFRGEYAWLSNFYPSPITIGDTYYPTVEHYYQANKATTITDFNKIRSCTTPGQAKRAGSGVKLREDWDSVKVYLMRRGLDAKFQNPSLKKKLLDTGCVQLIEGNYWHDNYWGSCYCPKCGDRGKNILGRLLMLVRASL